MNTELITYSDKTALNENVEIADVNKVKAADMNEIKSAINTGLIDLIYPVGAIFLSTVSANPSTYLGGTWTQIKDKFLLGAGDTYTAGATGGEATHTLTTNEMPSHYHGAGSGTSFTVYTGTMGLASGTYYTRGSQSTTASTGGGAAHNNMPPYIVVYVWQRTE